MVTVLKPESLDHTKHRPYPLSESPWAMSMHWHDLLFMHWPISEDALRSLIPPALEIDTFDGSAWLGVVPFRMSGVRPRFLPALPWLSNFPELNLRTYVSAGGRSGIWFFSLDAANPIAVRLARAGFYLPYFDSKMYCEIVSDEVRYSSVRTHRDTPGAKFVGRYRPIDEISESQSGTLESFLTERYCLYSADGMGRAYRGEIHHRMWPLQKAEAEIEKMEMTRQIGLELPDMQPLLHYSKRLDVLAWLPKRISE